MGNYLSWAVGLVYKSPSDHLRDAELQLLQKYSSTSCQSQFIPISNQMEIRTLRYDIGFVRGTAQIVVLLHGFMSGLGVWSPCFDLLSQHCIIYAVDLPGFGRSKRPQFFGDLNDIEYQFVNALEEWRDAVGIDSFVIVGHGFGGYIGTLYAMNYPDQVRHLILVEPWGYTELPFGMAGKAAVCSTEYDQVAYKSRIPLCIQFIDSLVNFMNPLFILRCLPKRVGMWICSRILKNTAPVLSAKGRFRHSMINYLYHCNQLRATGEYAVLRTSLLYFWAKEPLIERIAHLDSNVPISFIYGSESSVDHKTGFEVFHQRKQSIVEVFMVQNAGHNVFMDCPERFCDIVLHVIETENQREVPHSRVLSTCSSETGTEDLYWDCAWETINLSTANLNQMEGVKHAFQPEWEDFELGSNSEVFDNDTTTESDDEVYYPLD